MQVNSVNSNDTAFGARLRVKPKNIDHVMETIDKCDIKGLRRIYNAIKSGETGIGSKDTVFIEDASKLGKKVRPQKCGFLKAKIGNFTYTNDVIPTFSFWSLPHYFEKLQRVSKAKYSYPLKNETARLGELGNQFNIMFDKALTGGTNNSRGSLRRRDFLKDAIYSILSQKN